MRRVNSRPSGRSATSRPVNASGGRFLAHMGQAQRRRDLVQRTPLRGESLCFEALRREPLSRRDGNGRARECVQQITQPRGAAPSACAGDGGSRVRNDGYTVQRVGARPFEAGGGRRRQVTRQSYALQDLDPLRTAARRALPSAPRCVDVSRRLAHRAAHMEVRMPNGRRIKGLGRLPPGQVSGNGELWGCIRLVRATRHEPAAGRSSGLGVAMNMYIPSCYGGEWEYTI